MMQYINHTIIKFKIKFKHLLLNTRASINDFIKLCEEYKSTTIKDDSVQLDVLTKNE